MAVDCFNKMRSYIRSFVVINEGRLLCSPPLFVISAPLRLALRVSLITNNFLFQTGSKKQMDEGHLLDEVFVLPYRNMI